MKFKILILLTCISNLLFGQTNSEIEKLKDFAEIYGIVRYFHPSDENPKINWNQFAAFGVQQVLKTKNQNEFETSLKNIFTPIAPTLSFEGKEYSWNQTNLVPVFWIHKGLGLDILKERSIYNSNRYNRGKSEKKDYNYLYLTLSPNKIASNLKITYEAKSKDGVESFVYANIFNRGVEKANFKTHQKNPVTSENWEKKELVFENNLPVEKINFGLMCNKQGSEFRNIKLWYQNKSKEWIQYGLPELTDGKWKLNNPNIKVERSVSEIKFIDTSTNGINPYDISWDKFVKLDLSNNLKVVIPTVVYSDKVNTLPITDKESFSEMQSQLKTQDFNQNIALANVIISWNILKHFYPYQDVIKVNWEEILENALKDAYNDKDKYDNYLTLSRFGSNFNDGHLSFYYRGLNEKRNYAPGIAVRYIDGNLLVKNTILGVGEISKGDIIAEINGISSQKYLDSLQQYISGSKQFKNWISVQTFLKGTKNSTINLTINNDKKIMLKRDIEYVPNIDFYTRDDVAKSKEINKETYYVNMDKLSAAEMENEISNIRNYKNLIIDLRGYPRTDQGHQILNYLLPIEDSTKWMCVREILLPDFKYFKESCNGHRLRKYVSNNPLKTNNVLLVDERSVSNAEMFTQVVKHYKLATIIGRMTAGANGNRNDIRLLNDFQISFTGLKVVNPDGSRFHAIGVLPDIVINETPEDIKEQKDVYIETALDYLNDK